MLPIALSKLLSLLLLMREANGPSTSREIPKEILAKNHWYASSFDDSDRTYPTYVRKTIDIMKRAVYVLRMAYIYAMFHAFSQLFTLSFSLLPKRIVQLCLRIFHIEFGRIEAFWQPVQNFAAELFLQFPFVSGGQNFQKL